MKVFWLFYLALTLGVGLSLSQSAAENLPADISVTGHLDETTFCADCCAGCDEVGVTTVCPANCGTLFDQPVPVPGAAIVRRQALAGANGERWRSRANPPDPAPPKQASLIQRRTGA